MTLLQSASIPTPTINSSNQVNGSALFGLTNTSEVGTGFIVLNNIPETLSSYANLLNVFSGTNEYILQLQSDNSYPTYYKFTTTLSLPNPILSTTGQLSVYLYLVAYETSSSLYGFNSALNYNVHVTIESNGSFQESPIYPISGSELLSQIYNNVSPNSGAALPIYLTNLFPNFLQQVNTIYKVTAEVWQQQQ